MTTPPPYEPANNYSTPQEHSYATAPLVSKVMRKTFGWMTMCLLITALTALGVVNTPFFYQLISTGTFWILLVAELILVFVLSARVHKMSLATATTLLIIYSILNGATLSIIFWAYSIGSIAKAFFITTGMFAVMAFIGATTRRDLTKMGSFLLMALIGLIIVGVLLFTGLTAYDVQRVKRLALENDLYDDTQMGRLAVISALSLYLDFINLFLYLLRFFNRK